LHLKPVLHSLEIEEHTCVNTNMVFYYQCVNWSTNKLLLSLAVYSYTIYHQFSSDVKKYSATVSLYYDIKLLQLPNCSHKTQPYIKQKRCTATPCRRQGEKMSSSYSFLPSALDGSEWPASRPGRALPSGKDPRYLLYRRPGGPQSQSGHRG
jgi:hypothetical protein